jgi:hypothetical protein
VAIETPRGLFVASLWATGRPVYAINPLPVARYRERRSVARSKSDHADAMTLANILRVDAHLHRRLPADSELCQAIAVLARAHQDAIWRRTTAHHQLRSLLREFYPTFLAVFTSRFTLGIASPEARAVLAIAPTAAAAAKLSVSRVAAALRRAGRSRGIDQTAAEIKAELRKPQLHHPVLVENAMGKSAQALLAVLPPRAPMSTSSAWHRRNCSNSTPITRLSLVFRGWRTRPVPGCSPRSETTALVSRTPGH